MPQTKPTSEQVTFLQAGTGATQRTALAKLRDTVSVKDFGAVGDGVTDDTAAIQAAINAASYAVFIPAGNYRCNGRVNLKAHLSIFGSGMGSTIITRMYPATQNYDEGVFHAESSSSTTFIDQINISDMTFDGKVQDFPYNNGSPIFCQNMHLVSLLGTRNVQINRVEFLGFRGDGLHIGARILVNPLTRSRHNEDVLVSECFFDGVNNDGRNGVSIIDGKHIAISKCTFKRCTRADMPGPIDIEPEGYITTIIEDIKIDGNTIDETNGGFSLVHWYVPDAYSYTTPPRNLSITNNSFNASGTSQGAAIKCLAFQITPAALTTAVTPHGISISNNYIYRGTVVIQGVFGAKINGNIFQGRAGLVNTNSLLIGGIDTDRNCIDISVHNNKFIDIGGGNGAISVFACDNISIFANTFYRIMQTGFATKFVIGIFAESTFTSTISNLKIFDNHSTGTYLAEVLRGSVGTINLDGTNSYIYGNTTSTSNTWSLFNIANIVKTPTLSASNTWTPVLSDGGSVFTYGLQVGTYTRIGNIVFAFVDIQIATTTAAPTSTVTITGLPFTASGVATVNFNISSVDIPVGFNVVAGIINTSSSVINVRQNGDNVASAGLAAAAIIANSRLSASFTYTTS